MDATVRAGLVGVVTTLRPSAPRTGRADARLRDHAAGILGDGPVGWAVQAAADATGLVIELNPEDPLIPAQSVGFGNETLLLEVLLELVGAPPAASTIDPARQEIISDAAVRDVPIIRLVNSLRAVQQFWTRFLLDHATAIGAEPSVLGAIAVGLAGKIDRSVDKVLQDYLAERERLISGVAEQRRNIVLALTAGKRVDPGLVRDRLAIDVEHHHVALVLTTGTDGVSAVEDLSRAADQASRMLVAHTVVRHEAADGALWIWATAPQAPAVDKLRTAALGRGRIRVGVGSARPGADGFRRSHLEAVAAERTACLSGRGPLVLHPDVALAALLSQDPERARWFVDDRLGALAGADATAAELRATLRCYYGANLRLATAATQMHMHRNTFQLRLRRIEAIVGHPVTEHVADLQCALIIMDERDAGSWTRNGP